MIEGDEEGKREGGTGCRSAHFRQIHQSLVLTPEGGYKHRCYQSSVWINQAHQNDVCYVS